MKKILKKSNLIILLLIFVFGLVKTSYSYFISLDKIDNIFDIGNVDIKVNEEFSSPVNWDGNSYKKVVKIQNDSKSESLIRVALIPRWIDENGEPWLGDTNIVTFEYINIIEDKTQTTDSGWIYGEDGYYYYNKIVPKGEMTKEILTSVSVDIPQQLKDRYKDKTLIIDIKSEAVQATTEAHRETWKNTNIDIQNMLDSLCDR